MKRFAFIAMVSLLIPTFAFAANEEPAHEGSLEAAHGSIEQGSAEHHADHSEGAEGEHEHALKPINWSDFSNKEQPPYAVLVLNFAILLAIYYFAGRKAVVSGLKQRRDNIAKEIEDAAKIKAEAEERAKKYQTQLESLDSELESTQRSLVEAGKADKDRIVREANVTAERMKRDADALLVQEKLQKKQDLLLEAVTIATGEAEEMLRKRVTPADQERLAEEFLTQLAVRYKASAVSNQGGA